MKRQLRYYICNSLLDLPVTATSGFATTLEGITLDSDKSLVCEHLYLIHTRPASLSLTAGAFTFNLFDNTIQHALTVEPDFDSCHFTSTTLDNPLIAVRSEGKLSFRGFSAAMTSYGSFHSTNGS